MKILLFDIDGTLLTTHGAGASTIETVLRDDFGVADPDTSVNFAGRTDQGLLREIMANNGLADTREGFEQFRKAYCNRFPEHIRRVGGRVLEGAEALLRACRDSRHHRVFSMTGNCYPVAKEKLAFFGLASLIERVFGGDEDVIRDDMAKRTHATMIDEGVVPSPIHDAAANDASNRNSNAKGNAAEIVVIGDTPADIHCARAIDATVIAVATGRYDADELRSHQPDHMFGTLGHPGVAAALGL